MTIKEKPLINAASRMGPLPDFLFSNPFLAGFFSALMCAVFGGFAILIYTIGYGVGDATAMFEAVRWGAIAATALGAIAFIGVAISAFKESEETRPRLLFVLGGALGIAALVIIDRMTLETLRTWFADYGAMW